MILMAAIVSTFAEDTLLTFCSSSTLNNYPSLNLINILIYIHISRLFHLLPQLLVSLPVRLAN